MTRALRWTGTLALFTLACAGDPVAPASVLRPASLQLPESELHFLQTAAGAPALATTSVSFYAVNGQTRQAEIRYRNLPGVPAPNRLVRFRVDKRSLVKRPDGTPIPVGDSLLITLTVVDTVKMIVDFQPAGLVFNPKKPAKLTLWYLEADHDFNHDGVINAADTALEQIFAIWSEELPGDPWTRLPTVRSPSLDQVEAPVAGFTRFAVSY